jgi:phenylacetic acid degradation operon negative regulatory protein
MRWDTIASVNTAPSRHIDPKLRPLLRAFRAQRRIRARSLLITIFGDSVAPRGGEIALKSLIELARPFGASERLVRTSIGRLASQNWIQVHRSGRLSYYRLTDRGRHEFAVATQRIYGDAPQEWRGVWTLILMPRLSAAEREEIVEEFRWRGFGQVMPGVLAYPGDRLQEVRGELAKMPSGPNVVVLNSSTQTPNQDLLLVSRAWDLADLERRYHRFVQLFEPAAQAAEHITMTPVSCFALRTLLIHEYRRIHLRDPLLPPSLLPGSWSGGAAAGLTRTLYRRIFRNAEQFLSEHAINKDGPLPPAGPEALLRFGGLSS